MENLDVKRCPHYQMHSEPLDLEGPAVYFAVRRCLLSERMINMMDATPDGHLLASKLVVNAAKGRQIAFVGPDLEAVTQSSCTVKRCAERCTPSYTQNLQLFNITDPQEADVTCEDEQEKETQSEAAARQARFEVAVPPCVLPS